jgi:hypothetical protein
MRVALSAAVICGIFVCNLYAQTVVVNDDIQFTPTTDPFGHPAYSIHLRLSNTLLIGYDHQQATVGPFGTTLLYPGTRLFVVEPGNLLSESNIATGQFQELRFFDLQPTPVPVGGGETGFYLGVAELSEEYTDQLGWIHLRPRILPSSELEMVQNVMSYNTRGIIVGTTTIVPEPGNAIFLCCVLFVTAAARKRRR